MTGTKADKVSVKYEAPDIIDVGSIVKVTRTLNENVRDNPGGFNAFYHDPAIVRVGSELIDIPSE